MALKINLIEEMNPAAPNVIAQERLWLTADKSHVVREGDPAAAFLLAVAGSEIPRAEAERLGLVKGAKTPKPKTGGKDAMVNRLQAEGEAAEEAKEETEAPDEAVEEDLDTLSYRELQDRCKLADISGFGSRETLIKRLHDIDSAGAEEETEE